jgi:small subunit ribosomal protein S6
MTQIGDRMPLYEHVMIARQDLSNTQAEALIEHFGAVLADNGGTLVDHEYWGVKTMAYKINKNRKGHYAFLRTDAPASAVQEMERLMRLHDDVMRVLTIKVDAHEEGPSAQMQKRDDRDRGDRDREPRRRAS